MMLNFSVCLLFLNLVTGNAPASQAPSNLLETQVPRVNQILVGAELEFLVPDNLSGFSMPQTLSGAHVGVSFGQDQLMVSGFYSSNQETSALVLGEVDYRFNLATPFITGYALTGLHYLHFRVAFQNKDFVGPVVGLGFDLPMAQSFKMGLQMKLYYPRKTMLGFGGGFSFLF
ncbi:MAG: hypothetical protein EBR01_01055 [Proteobacteria bacterium]|jgi:hypothetical protein|nr:hypothetical protein [Pseudomonadota bacterium]